MGRRGSINEAQVFEAADALVAQGREVTPTALLSVLGSGSFTTIYKHLSAWEESRVPAGSERTAAIPDAVLSAFGAAWRTASAEAGREVLVVREQAAEEVKAAKGQFQEALQTIERLEADSEIDAGHIETLTAKVVQLQAGLQKAETETAALKARAEQLQHQVTSQGAELERVHTDTESARKRHQEEIAQLRKSEETAVKEAAELRGKAATLKAQNDELLSRLTERGKGLGKSEETRNRS